MDAQDLAAVWLTLRLAAVTTFLLLLLGTPLAWWLARTQSWLKGPVGAVVALPLVLPPTVLGFYLLITMGPAGPVGAATQALGLGLLPFTFPGLVIGSVFYSLPFVVQPLQAAFEALGARPMEAAATLRAGPWDRFFTVAVPLARQGFVIDSYRSVSIASDTTRLRSFPASTASFLPGGQPPVPGSTTAPADDGIDF